MAAIFRAFTDPSLDLEEWGGTVSMATPAERAAGHARF
jgi:hypothetical protein